MAGTKTKKRPKSYWRDRKREQRARKKREQERAQLALAGGPALADAADVELLISWAESKLIVPSGLRRGKAFVLPEWEKAFLRAAFAPGIYEGYLSTARKNGKTGIVAVLCLGILCGPLARLGWRAIATSLTGKNVAELLRAIETIAAASDLTDKVKIYRSPPPGRVRGLHGAEIEFLAADRGTGHSASVNLAILDEGGLLGENDRGLWDALQQSTAAEAGKFVCISVMGDGPMMAEAWKRRAEPDVCFHRYSADPDCDLLDEGQWQAANPGLGEIKSLAYMRRQARKAANVPASAGNFRCFDLNIPGAAASSEMFCSPQQWQACVVGLDDLPPRRGSCVVGLDLGGSASLTALAAYWPETGRLEAYAGIAGEPDLAARGQADGVGGRYELMAARGELLVYPGFRATPVAEFVRDMADRLGGSAVQSMSCDRYRQAELEDVLAQARLDWTVRYRGQGWLDGNEDLIAAQKLVLEGRVQTAESVMLVSSIREAVIQRDAAGNGKLNRSRARGRIDGAQALVLALAAGAQYRPDPSFVYVPPF